VTLAVVLNKQLGLWLGKIATLLQERFGLTITCGGLVHAVRRAARQAEPTNDALCETIRGSPVVSLDETGWKVDAHLQWLWGFATPDTTVYAIQPGRGFEEAAAVLGRTLTVCWSATAGRRIAASHRRSIKRASRIYPDDVEC
jgi:hypothetical protein